jgi:hypothetical protein
MEKVVGDTIQGPQESNPNESEMLLSSYTQAEKVWTFLSHRQLGKALSPRNDLALASTVTEDLTRCYRQ